MIYLIFFIAVTISLVSQFLNLRYNLPALCRRIRTRNHQPLERYGIVIPGRTMFGNNFDQVSFSLEEIFAADRENVKHSRGRSYFQFYFGRPVYNIVRAEEVGYFMNSQAFINRSSVNGIIKPLLGEGLLLSNGLDWLQKRKLMFPAFRENILQQYLDTFNDATNKFIQFLDNNTDENGIICLSGVIPKFAHQSIVETTLGIKIDECKRTARYWKNMISMDNVFMRRIINPFMHHDWIYKIFLNADKKHDKIIKKLKKFSSKIVTTRRETFRANKNQNKNETEENSDLVNKRSSVLDTLLEAETKNLINHRGICEEVDMCMFAGTDPLSSALIFTILLLGSYQSVQQKCYDEIKDITDLSSLTAEDYNNFNYLECTIKECLRLFPPIPIVRRKSNKPVFYKNFIFPVGTEIHVHIFDIQRDPRHFPQPKKFNPERFLLENSINRHRNAFIPFSAVPKICIGEKFALLNMKVLLVKLLLKFKIKHVTKPNEIIFRTGIVLGSKHPIFAKLEKRQ